MKQALYYKKLKNKAVQCQLCPRFCSLKPNETGDCKARKNINGELFSLVYGRSVSSNLDPVEKKPLFHFLPGTSAYSIGTTGCNLHCLHCQNWETSQASIEEFPVVDLPPEKVVNESIKTGCRCIAFTYNEPTVFYEYALDTAKLAKKKGIKNVIVSNGFINKEPLSEWCKYIDGANIDVKGFDDKFYREVTTAWLSPILECLKMLRRRNVWLEITNLIIPGLNDDTEKIKEMCKWIKDNLGLNSPLHFTAFYPCYKLLNIEATPVDILIKARKIALETGLNYVYIGNVSGGDFSNTYCPKCKSLLIERSWIYRTEIRNLKDGKCVNCREKIGGVWK